MYTNELLEEKYKAQLALIQKAQNLSKDYFSVVEEEVHALFKKMGWAFHFSKRKGEWQPPHSAQNPIK